MSGLLSKLFGVRSKPRHTKSATPQYRPTVEALEDRQLMSITSLATTALLFGVPLALIWFFANNGIGESFRFPREAKSDQEKLQNSQDYFKHVLLTGPTHGEEVKFDDRQRCLQIGDIYSVQRFQQRTKNDGKDTAGEFIFTNVGSELADWSDKQGKPMNQWWLVGSAPTGLGPVRRYRPVSSAGTAPVTSRSVTVTSAATGAKLPWR
jgi:hypothetical protein